MDFRPHSTWLILLLLDETTPVSGWVMATYSLQQYGTLSMPMWLLIVIILDLVARERRDWLHWLGVRLIIGNALQLLIWTVGLRFVN